jgi:KUP system potassium uptake protein
MAALMVGALGVVFGDLGTSPLYSLPGVFSGHGSGVQPTQTDVYGVISLIFWVITLVVTVKYVVFIMRADNNGEGGIMALIGLVQDTALRNRKLQAALLAVGVFGASLFYGDGVITPAISVLSAVEGLKVATPSLDSLVVPIAVVVLVLLFGIQRFGTGRVGLLFGPIMLVWFVSISVAGLGAVIAHPGILRALSPTYAASFWIDQPGVAFAALAAVVLAVTGAEALYADIGHFGRPPIRRAWLLVVFPAVTLSYLGQGALVLQDPSASDLPFFRLIPHALQIPMVLLATAATVIASQGLITGAFSMTHQAVQLGFLPRLAVRHTSERERGQVYVPAINWMLMTVVVALVVGFGSSRGLANAFGVAFTGTMVITTILFVSLMRFRWKRPWWVVVATGTPFLAVDLTLFSATLTKVPHGGWIALTIALVAFTVLMTWRQGRTIVMRRRAEEQGPLDRFVEETRTVYRVPGTAVFLSGSRATTPIALRANLEHNHVVHEHVVIVCIETLNVPHVKPSERLTVDELGYGEDGITTVTVRFGYHDRQEVAHAVAAEDASYFLSRVTLVRTADPVMSRWRKQLFIALWRLETDPAVYYGFPDERAVTMGSLIEL